MPGGKFDTSQTKSIGLNTDKIFNAKLVVDSVAIDEDEDDDEDDDEEAAEWVDKEDADGNKEREAAAEEEDT